MRFSLHDTAVKVGLTKRTIRALEIRYAAVKPVYDLHQKPFYSAEDLERLKYFSEAIKLGMDVKTIAHCTNDELELKVKLYKIDNQHPLFDNLQEAVSMVENYDAFSLQKLLYDMRIELSREKLIYDFILPLVTIKSISGLEKSFVETELLSFLADIIKSSKTKEYHPHLILFCHHDKFKTLLFAVASLLSGFKINISFAATTNLKSSIYNICYKVNCEAALLLGPYKKEVYDNPPDHIPTYFEIVDISAQELINTEFSQENFVLKDKVEKAIENIKKALNL